MEYALHPCAQKIFLILFSFSHFTASQFRALYTPWTTVVPCSSTCGPGYSIETRQCLKDCVFSYDSERYMPCFKPCPGYFHWAAWSGWKKERGSEKVTPRQSRVRNCKDYEQKTVRSQNCEGNAAQTAIIIPGGVSGQWGIWMPWQACTRNDCGGIKVRFRECDNPVPLPPGKDCKGKDWEKIACGNECGTWSDWLSLGSCDKTCGYGKQEQRRECYTKRGEDARCSGQSVQTIPCHVKPCKVHGAWSNWTLHPCSVTCGKGIRFRERKCNNPEPRNEGNDCDGPIYEYVSCEREGACYSGPSAAVIALIIVSLLAIVLIILLVCVYSRYRRRAGKESRSSSLSNDLMPEKKDYAASDYYSYGKNTQYASLSKKSTLHRQLSRHNSFSPSLADTQTPPMPPSLGSKAAFRDFGDPLFPPPPLSSSEEDPDPEL